MTVRVLHVVSKWGPGKGGVKSFISTIVNGCSENIENSVLSIGRVEGEKICERFYGPLVDSYSPISLMFAAHRLIEFLRDGGYDVVHIHTNNGLGFLHAWAAQKAGVPMRIVHSHNSKLGDRGWAKTFMHHALMLRFADACTDRWACSAEAAAHLFGNESYKEIHNGIDIPKFEFDSVARLRVRDNLKISDRAPVLVCVGAGIPAKNTIRLVEIFRSVIDVSAEARLLLLGSGRDYARVQARVDELGLSESVDFLGFTDHPEEFYSAADVMVMPSLYEGLPICVVEAQANGLPVLVSEVVSKEVALTELVGFMRLEENNIAWAKTALLMAGGRDTDSSVRYGGVLSEKGYSQDAVCSELESQYITGAAK